MSDCNDDGGPTTIGESCTNAAPPLRLFEIVETLKHTDGHYDPRVLVRDLREAADEILRLRSVVAREAACSCALSTRMLQVERCARGIKAMHTRWYEGLPETRPSDREAMREIEAYAVDIIEACKGGTP